LASFELDFFGRVRALTDAAAARLQASDEGRRAAMLSLVAAVTDTELALRADDAQITLTRQVLAAREATLRLVQARVAGGVAAAPELRANESLVASARAGLAALERQRRQRENALALLVGGPAAGRTCRRRARWSSTGCPSCRPGCRRRCCWPAPTCARPSSS
jgi:outer membrane protein, multidrug efflux system